MYGCFSHIGSPNVHKRRELISWAGTDVLNIQEFGISYICLLVSAVLQYYLLFKAVTAELFLISLVLGSAILVCSTIYLVYILINKYFPIGYIHEPLQHTFKFVLCWYLFYHFVPVQNT